MAAITPTTFLFHPFDASHSRETQLSSIITTIALSILTCGAYLLLMGGVHVYEFLTAVDAAIAGTPVTVIPEGSRANRIKTKQADHLEKLQALAQAGQWQHLQRHTAHPHSGFDWWMFPIDRTSAGQGDLYRATPVEVTSLKADPAFMDSYRAGVKLVALSWGWDLESNVDVTDSVKHWTGYEVRLGKMLDSLKLFGETELHARLSTLVQAGINISNLSLWVQNLL